MADITSSTFKDFFSLGMVALPVKFNQSRVVTHYPEHDEKKTSLTLAYSEDLLTNGFKGANGVAIKLFPPFGMIDIDAKNTDNPNIYHTLVNSFSNINENILKKVCIEKTRNGGHHIYLKYERLDHKIPIARNKDGAEVISIYTGGLLSFCSPSPGYEIIHNDFNDLDYLTDDEFDTIVSTCAVFNEYELKPGESKVQLISYPIEYKTVCDSFDSLCTDEVFEQMLNDIGLYKVVGDKFSRKKYTAFLRKGSLAEYSAKVYFKSKRLLIFSGSMAKFPTWHDSAKAGDNRWSLSPSKIIFYKNNRVWADTVAEIKMICDSAGIDFPTVKPVTSQPLIPEDQLQFPYDIFPEEIQDFISMQVIQHEYLAGAILVALATALGNSVNLQAMDGYEVKSILYMAIVAPPGSFKTPALKAAFWGIERFDANLYKKYVEKKEEYRRLLAEWQKDKKQTAEPQPPVMDQVLIKDSTIEMVVKILSYNEGGCCVFADELSGFLNRMNQYKQGDEVQKWLELWSGSPVLLQRMTREENKVEDPFCCVVGGIQTGVLESMSKNENEHNGFYHRFLFVYPEPNPKADWQPIKIPESIKAQFQNYFTILLNQRDQKVQYVLTNAADNLYKQWFNHKNKIYNKAVTDDIKGVIAKYQDYCLRFALLLQAIYERKNRTGWVEVENMERAIRLTDYFFGNMNKATKILSPQTPVDSLKKPYDIIYTSLPETFTLKAGGIIAERNGIKDAAFRAFVIRNLDLKTGIFIQSDRGVYEKRY